MRRALVLASLLGLMLLFAASGSGRAFAEPQMEVHPPRSRCVVPFEIFANGLEPSQDVLVDIVVGGVVTGSVGGRSEPDGRFWSPIPLVLLPCGPGGVVTANLKIDGTVVVTTTFEIAPPIQPPPADTATPAPGPPATGNASRAPGGRPNPLPMTLAVAILIAGSVATFGWRSHRR